MPRAPERGRAAVRAGVAGDDRDEVLPCVRLEIATRAGTGEVVIDLVGTAGPLLGITQGDIAHEADASGRFTGR